ncbi:MAG: type VI secretion system ATPase TssH, partial [Candidatus Parcubacteria bacterium]|nr:type VI secretion system ATPase TssH [Burkholderiales bacterium]
MRYDKFTTKLQEAFGEAQSLALGQDHQQMEPQHLLLALLNQEDGGVASLVSQAGGNPNSLKQGLTQSIARLPKVEGTPGEVHVSRDLGNLLNVADKDAQKRGDQYIASELFLLACASDKGEAGKLLKTSGISKPSLEKAIEQLRGGANVASQADEGQRQALKKYTMDLTERARIGKLDPVIGRDDEIRRCIQILQRRTKNNPVLIGEPGVGKTAIVEGLAIRVADGTVQAAHQDVRIYDVP